MSTKDTLGYVPIDLQPFEIYPKVSEMLNFIIDKFNEDYADIINKYQNPAEASEEVIDRVIRENGFFYIQNVAGALTNVDTSILLNFMSLLHFMKGTRAGLELVLELLGFTSEIVEWWETTPPGPEHTFDMTVNMDLSNVDDVFATLARIRLFTQHYVYPTFNLATVVFAFEVADAHTLVGAFASNDFNLGLVEESI